MILNLGATSMHESELIQSFLKMIPKNTEASLLLLSNAGEHLYFRQNILQPYRSWTDQGALITIYGPKGYSYAATSTLTTSGLQAAIQRAQEWLKRAEKEFLLGDVRHLVSSCQGFYSTPQKKPWHLTPIREKIGSMSEVSQKLKNDPSIIDWSVSATYVAETRRFVTSRGGDIRQEFTYIVPGLSATAHQGSDTITRSLGVSSRASLGGLEVLDAINWDLETARITTEARELVAAPNCPVDTLDVLLDPEQMMLQIHESIGHPLEIDRILGDERNYAGRSFVTKEMFGTYAYGSPLLNIVFDPLHPGELASYAFDDDGHRATKEFLIKDGLLVRGIGGLLSQERSGLPGIATSRTTSWNRPPIDRISNINMLPGTSSMEEMIASIDKGILMATNVSWSIDDSRNKFQFGCEYGRLISNGKLGAVVKKPNYRGISAEFWHRLAMVGDSSTYEVLGTPYCGKGEPNQVIRVGHASPACVFRQIDVFGGI